MTVITITSSAWRQSRITTEARNVHRNAQLLVPFESAIGFLSNYVSSKPRDRVVFALVAVLLLPRADKHHKWGWSANNPLSVRKLTGYGFSSTQPQLVGRYVVRVCTTPARAMMMISWLELAWMARLIHTSTLLWPRCSISVAFFSFSSHCCDCDLLG